MKAVLEILSDNIDAGKCVLICEASNDGFSYLVKNDETNDFVALAVYHFNNVIISEGNSSILKGIFKDQILLSENFKKIYIIYSFPESVLVPYEMYNSQKTANILDMIHGDLTENNAVLSDVIIDIKAYNIYRVPSKLIDEISTQFPAANSIHQFSALAKKVSTTGNKLSVIFYPHKIVLMVQKEDMLLLINSFLYKTAEDVSYILLNTCQQFEMENVHVEVGGLIEKDSALYKEVYKYFERVSFAGLPEGINITEDVAAYPSHFFSHFFAAI